LRAIEKHPSCAGVHFFWVARSTVLRLAVGASDHCQASTLDSATRIKMHSLRRPPAAPRSPIPGYSHFVPCTPRKNWALLLRRHRWRDNRTVYGLRSDAPRHGINPHSTFRNHQKIRKPESAIREEHTY